MNAFMFCVIVLLLCLPGAWFASEFQERRWLRVVLGSLSLFLCVGVAGLVGGVVERLYSNAWFGSASKSLVNAIVEELEAGETDRVIQALKGLQKKYQPTYENRARYDELVKETLGAMGRPPASLL